MRNNFFVEAFYHSESGTPAAAAVVGGGGGGEGGGGEGGSGSRRLSCSLHGIGNGLGDGGGEVPQHLEELRAGLVQRREGLRVAEGLLGLRVGVDVALWVGHALEHLDRGALRTRPRRAAHDQHEHHLQHHFEICCLLSAFADAQILSQPQAPI